jgi:hypothetical protein
VDLNDPNGEVDQHPEAFNLKGSIDEVIEEENKC